MIETVTQTDSGLNAFLSWSKNTYFGDLDNGFLLYHFDNGQMTSSVPTIVHALLLMLMPPRVGIWTVFVGIWRHNVVQCANKCQIEGIHKING